MNPIHTIPASPAALRHDRPEFNVVFIHSALDDLGLSAAQFRVYCHLARRANTGSAAEGCARAAVRTMARVCRLHPQTVRAALKWLTHHRLLIRDSRPGRPTRYRLTAASRWRPPAAESATPVSVSEDTPANPIPAHPYETDGDEGNPSEGYPMKEHPHTLAAMASPSLEEVLETATLRSIPPDCAEKFFHEKESVGWLDRHNRPLRNWMAALQAFAVSWRAVEHRQAKASPARPRPRGAAFAIVSSASFTSTEI